MMFFKKYFKEIFLVVIIILVLGLYGVLYYEYFYLKNTEIIKEEIPIQINNEDIKEEKEKKSEEKLYVEVKGAVKHPGVYSVLKTNIVNDVLVMAGGFNSNAYKDNINLSKKVKDEMVIIIYTNEEINQNEVPVIKETVYEYVEKECNCETYNIEKCLDSETSIIVTDEKQEDVSITNDNESENKLININTASKEELMTISGIGEAKAKSIIEYRESNGLFNDPKDIINVSGISENIYEKIKDYITV